MNAVPDEGKRARAVLGVDPAASAAQVRQRYLDLVRRWHPDRFATDPRSQAEAEARMRDINHAYQVLADHAPRPAAASPARPTIRTGERLSREQINRMVQSIGTHGPLDGFMAAVGKLEEPSFRLWLLLALLASIPWIADLFR
jgi:curved DNA-binding protein CbpA